MSTAGISNNKDSQIKYLRAQAEYDVAWVKYFDEICKVIKRYDGKQATKRIATALKKVNDNITFEIERNGYNDYIYVGWYDYDGRIWRNDTSDEWSYLRTSDGKHHIIMALVEDIYHIDANNLIEQIANSKNQAVINYNKTIEALNNFDVLKDEYNKAVKALKEIDSKIPPIISSRYALDGYSVTEWGNYFRG